jgi:hypothetical protein
VQHDQDTQLMLEFQRSDAKSFDILFKKYSVSLINFAYRFLGNRTKAEEVAQEVQILYMDLPNCKKPLPQRVETTRVSSATYFF